MYQTLFASSDLDAWLASKRSEAEEALRREGVPSDWALDEALRHGRVHPIELHRDQAEFDVSESPEGVAVRLGLPFHGEPRLLDLRPTEPVDGSVQGEVVEHDGVGHRLNLRTTFPLGTPTDRIRQWAKEQVDLLEKVIGRVNGEVRAHNDGLPEHARKLISQRKAQHDDVERLRRELSGRGV